MQHLQSSSFSSFRTTAFSMSRLTVDEERDLCRKKETGCLVSAKTLVEKNLWLVFWTAKKYRSYGVPEEDLVQEGSIGLMKAVKAFDLSKNVRLGAFAYVWIKGSILNYIFNAVGSVRLPDTTAFKTAFFKLRSTGDNVSKGAKQLGISEDVAYQVLNNFGGSESIYGDDGELIFDAPDGSIDNVENIHEEQRRVILDTALETLSDRQAYIIRKRYLEDTVMTLDELSKEFGVSKQRIDQIEKEGIKKLKAILFDGENLS